MVIPQSGSNITIPTLKEKNKVKREKDIYRIIRKKNLHSPEKEKNDQFCLISLADAMFLK